MRVIQRASMRVIQVEDRAQWRGLMSEWLTRIVSVGVGRQVPGKAAYRVFQIL
jgi:hypothetical protein